jgi:hypothetical protein
MVSCLVFLCVYVILSLVISSDHLNIDQGALIMSMLFGALFTGGLKKFGLKLLSSIFLPDTTVAQKELISVLRMLTSSNIVFQILLFLPYSRIWPCFMFTRKHIKASEYNTIFKPTLPTEIQATWSPGLLLQLCFRGGRARVYEYPTPPRGTSRYMIWKRLAKSNRIPCACLSKAF